MNIFKFPKSVCEEINGVLAKFWWSNGEERKGMHWFAWKRMSLSKIEGGMGFRDFENFNLALLGKQIWRILQNPECLMAKILKQRYFNDTNILNAIQKKKSSFVWKSLLQGRDLIKQGLRFAIGSGSHISAWVDPWLPVHPPRPPRAKNAHEENQLLKTWIQNGSAWNEDLIREKVVEDDANMILSMKLCSSAPQDMLGWHYTQNGLYTVKSAYWLANQLHRDHNLQAPPGNLQIKAKIWKLHTAPKLKHFFWKIVSDALATGTNLRRRHIRDQPICRRCCQAEETSQHLFFDCFYAQQVWRASGFPNQQVMTPGISIETKLDIILSGILTRQQSQLIHLAIWILWRLWKSRNLLAFQQRSQSWQTTLQQARNDVNDWHTTTNYLQSLQITTMNKDSSGDTIRHNRWQRPPVGWVKVNYDGSFNHQTRCSSAGWIIRDENGAYKGAGQSIGNRTTCALESEIQASIIAMQHVWSQGYRKVIFEGDCKQVEELLNNKQIHFGCCN